MNALSNEQYNLLAEEIEVKLDETGLFAESIKERLTHDEVFENIKNNLCKACKSSF